MAVHILGNGPSLTKLFRREDWPESDVFIGCNFSDESLRPDYTMFIDIRPLRLFGEKGYRLHIPTIISDKANDYIVNELKHRFRSDYINIREVYPLIHWTGISKKTAMNSGHHAVMYAIQREQCKNSVIHIWGTDSLWQDDLVSLTDAYTRPTVESRVEGERALVWRSYWLEIFKRHPDHEFVIHHPVGSNVDPSITELSNTSVKSSY